MRRRFTAMACAVAGALACGILTITPASAAAGDAPVEAAKKNGICKIAAKLLLRHYHIVANNTPRRNVLNLQDMLVNNRNSNSPAYTATYFFTAHPHMYDRLARGDGSITKKDIKHYIKTVDTKGCR